MDENCHMMRCFLFIIFFVFTITFQVILATDTGNAEAVVEAVVNDRLNLKRDSYNGGDGSYNNQPNYTNVANFNEIKQQIARRIQG